jgi:CelD/BcsL family acetyltransferase involved in cellulose biosynthesis
MRVHVVHPSELRPAEVASWHAMQRMTPSLAHPFLSPEFAVAVGRYQPQARVAVLADGQDIIGFFPFETRRFGVGVPISGWLSACQGVIHAPDARWDCGELMRECGLAAWRFDNLIADQAATKAYHAAIASAPVIDLTEGFGAYYAKLRVGAPRMCRELERKARKLAREAGELHLVCDSSDPALLRLLIAWKSEQYRRTDTVDRFARPWVGELLMELLNTRTDYLTGLLSVLYAGEQPVSVQFGLRAGGLLIGWFAGYDIPFARYSPGLTQIRLMTEELAHIGVNRLHMGKGAKRYTEDLKNSDIFVGAGIVTSRTVAGSAYRIRNTVSEWALRTTREHRGLHDVADLALRRTGLSRLIYGRLLRWGWDRSGSSGRPPRP